MKIKLICIFLVFFLSLFIVDIEAKGRGGGGRGRSRGGGSVGDFILPYTGCKYF